MVTKRTAPSAAGASNKRRASVACQNCRLCKVKCDAQSLLPGQACSPCRRAGQSCRLDPTSDGRRTVSWKYVDDLQQRIRTLEALNQREGVRIHPDSGTNVAASVVHECPGLIEQHASQSPGVDRCPPPRSNAQSAGISTASTDVQHRPFSSLPVDSGSAGEKASENLSSFFGLTSHPHVGSPVESSTQPCEDQVVALGIDIDANSPRLRNHLIQSFFKYQTLWVDIVDKACFSRHRKPGVPTRWYCDFLEYAMLACATRIQTSSAVRSLGREYAQLAKSEMLGALLEPTPASMQGFLLLSEYEVTQGNDRPGWMFCGIACRMLSDLGLHELADINGASNGPEEESTRESALAYALLSACIIYEGVWTLYLGRPSSIPKSIMSIAATRCKAQRSSDSPLLNAWLGLCIPMSEISHILNNQYMEDSNASSLPHLIVQMKHWYDNLPPELAYNESRLTSLDMAGYGLHTQYCKVQILLRQALNKNPSPRKRRYSQMTSDAIPEMISEDSSRTIYRESLRIARLVVTYKEVFGVEKIPSIMLDNAVVAATALIKHFNQISVVDARHGDEIWIRSLVKSLEAVQPHFPITKRMLDALKYINAGSLLADMFQPPAAGAPAELHSELPTLSHSTQPGDAFNMLQPTFNTAMNNSDGIWGSFGVDISPTAFFWGGLDNLPEISLSGAPFQNGHM